MDNKFSVLIVGAGRIGATFDTPESESVLTHAHAFSKHPGFRLEGFVENDGARGAHAAQVWRTRHFDSLEQAFAVGRIDVVVIASPDDTHATLLRQVATRNVKFVFAEKPITLCVSDAREIITSYTTRNIGLGVNYSRRFVPEFQNFQRRIRAGEFGEFIAAHGYFCRGTLHNGSHVIDLLQWMLGNLTYRETLARFDDYEPWDPTCEARLSTESGGQILLQGLPTCPYSMLELDLLCTGGRIRIADSGFRIETERARAHPVFPGFAKLEVEATVRTSFVQAMPNAIAAIYEFLLQGKPFPCSGSDALKALEIATQIVGDSD